MQSQRIGRSSYELTVKSDHPRLAMLESQVGEQRLYRSIRGDGISLTVTELALPLVGTNAANAESDVHLLHGPGGAHLLDVPRKRLLIGPLIGRRGCESLFKTADMAPQKQELGKPQENVDPQIFWRLTHGLWLTEGAFCKFIEQIGPCVWSPVKGRCAGAGSTRHVASLRR